MQQCPHLQRFVTCEGVFLDTTYCHPKHVFPTQSVSVEEVGRLCEECMNEDPQRCMHFSFRLRLYSLFSAVQTCVASCK